ncbi:homeobox protein engrailed-2-like [Manacus candei]|uniref:homeobox protein engrailed-2-like n=1 Tax=Manacus candei TaxID=415023 RepID=UPI002226A354|nr:homeobox protein engrailed-2-like [Manacus candei]
MRGPAAAPSGAARAGGGGRRAAAALIYLFIPARKMDAIKITRGRTRRSQGAGDALGGPSSAAAGGRGGGQGDTARPPVPPPALPAGRAQSGTRSAGPSPESSPGAKELAGGAPAPSRRRRKHREGRGGSGSVGRQSPHSPIHSKARRRSPNFGLGTGEQRQGERRDGRRAGLPPPSRERHRCSAVRVQPSRAADPPSPTNTLLGCPSV